MIPITLDRIQIPNNMKRNNRNPILSSIEYSDGHQHSEKVILGVQSQDSQSQSGFDKMSNKKDHSSTGRDWRAYFNLDELDNAFQIVEVENRDIPEEESEDGGSNSDPSDDNLDPDELNEKVYQMPEDKK